MLPAAHLRDHHRRLLRYLPQVLVATAVVTLGPLAVVWTARATGLVVSTLPLILLGVLVSLALSTAGSAYWKSRPGSGDLLFGELMLWGWLWRWRTERRLASAIDLLGLTGKAQRARIGDLGPARQVQLLEELASALEARDPYTHGHSRRVARHASVIAERMGLSRGQVARIRAAAAIHDVGKIETPNRVLNKKGQLTDEEFAVIQRHPFAGAKMAYPLGDEELAWMVLYHHERLDGGGYPLGLSGQEIPLGARIIAVADTFDALTSSRPYRSAKSHRLALRILAREAGTRLDPTVVRAFTSHYSARRSVAIWALISSFPQRLLFPFVGEINAVGGAGSAAKVIAATAAAAAVGSAAVGQPIASPLHADSSNGLPAVAKAGAASDHTALADGSGAAAGPAERPVINSAPATETPTERGEGGASSVQLTVPGESVAVTGSEASVTDVPVTLVPASPSSGVSGGAISAAPAAPSTGSGATATPVSPANPGTGAGAPAAPPTSGGSEPARPPSGDGGGLPAADTPPADDGVGGIVDEIAPANPGSSGQGHGNANGQGNGNGQNGGPQDGGGGDETIADGGLGALIDDPGTPQSDSGEPPRSDGDQVGRDQGNGHGNGNANGQGNGNGGVGQGNGDGHGQGGGDPGQTGAGGILDEIDPGTTDTPVDPAPSDTVSSDPAPPVTEDVASETGDTAQSAEPPVDGGSGSILDEIDPGSGDSSGEQDNGHANGADNGNGQNNGNANGHDNGNANGPGNGAGNGNPDGADNGNHNGADNGNHNGADNSNGHGDDASGIETILAEIDPSDGGVSDVLVEIDPSTVPVEPAPAESTGYSASTAAPAATVAPAEAGYAPAADGSEAYAAPPGQPAAASGDDDVSQFESIAGVVIGIIAGSPESGAGSYIANPPADTEVPPVAALHAVDAATAVPADPAAETVASGD